MRLVVLMTLLAWLTTAATAEKKDKSWWEKREERKPDIYFPHNVHMPFMKEEGDMCMLCHSYQPTALGIRAASPVRSVETGGICYEYCRHFVSDHTKH